MLDGRWRAGVERGLQPVGTGLRRIGLSADALTVAGLGASVAAAVLVATGRFGWAAVAVVAAGLSDILDGAIARTSGQAGPRGAFFDSVSDRVSDALLLGGAAWYFAGSGDPRLAVLAFAVGASSMLVSYERAKAESLGFEARGGLMERAERFVLLGIGLAFDVLVPVLWIMLALTLVTAADRFRRVWRQADRPARRPHRSRRADRPAPPVRTWWGARRPGAENRRRAHARARGTRP